MTPYGVAVAAAWIGFLFGRIQRPNGTRPRGRKVDQAEVSRLQRQIARGALPLVDHRPPVVVVTDKPTSPRDPWRPPGERHTR